MLRSLFVTVGFVYSRWRSTVTDGWCGQNTGTARFFSHICTVSSLCTHHICGSRCRTTCLHKTCSSTCHHMSERLLFVSFVFFCLSCFYFLSHFYLFSSQGINPLRTRTKRSISTWLESGSVGEYRPCARIRMWWARRKPAGLRCARQTPGAL